MDKISLHSFAGEYNLPKSSVYRKCKELNIPTAEGLSVEDCDRLLEIFGLAPAPAAPAPEPEAPTIMVESGNHQITLAAPELPQTYTLEGLRQSEVVQFEDPLAVAQQFLQVADSVIQSMNQDVQTRQQRLNQTVQAKDAIAAKKQKLELEARLYQLQTGQIDAQTSKETADLAAALAALQNLGKPVESSQEPQS